MYPVRRRNGGLLLAAPPSEALLAALVPDPPDAGETGWGKFLEVRVPTSAGVVGEEVPVIVFDAG